METTTMGLYRAQVLGFRVQGLEVRIWDLGLKVQDVEFRV